MAFFLATFFWQKTTETKTWSLFLRLEIVQASASLLRATARGSSTVHQPAQLRFEIFLHAMKSLRQSSFFLLFFRRADTKTAQRVREARTQKEGRALWGRLTEERDTVNITPEHNH